MKALIELHFQHENVLRSTLSYTNETSKECIQFLNNAIRKLIPLTHIYMIANSHWLDSVTSIKGIGAKLLLRAKTSPLS